MEDWLKCQISLLVKYRQNQKTTGTEKIYLECLCTVGYPIASVIQSVSLPTGPRLPGI